MRKKLPPVLAGGLLLGGAALLVLRWTDQPSPPGFQDHRSQQAGIIDPLLEKNGRDPHPSGKRQNRPLDGDPMLQKTLEALANSTEAELPDRLEKITATWPREGALILGGQSVLQGIRRCHHGPAEDNSWSAAGPRWSRQPPPRGRLRFLRATPVPRSSNKSASSGAPPIPQRRGTGVYTLPQDAARDSAMVSLLYEISNSSPGLTISRADALPESPSRSQLIEHAIGNWAASDPQAALERAREIADPALRNTSLASLATTWAESI